MCVTVCFRIILCLKGSVEGFCEQSDEHFGSIKVDHQLSAWCNVT